MWVIQIPILTDTTGDGAGRQCGVALLRIKVVEGSLYR